MDYWGHNYIEWIEKLVNLNEAAVSTFKATLSGIAG